MWGDTLTPYCSWGSSVNGTEKEAVWAPLRCLVASVAHLVFRLGPVCDLRSEENPWIFAAVLQTHWLSGQVPLTK